MLAIQCVKSIPAWLLLKALGQRFPRLYTSSFSLTRMRDVGEPKLPNTHWARIQPLLCGICGSDLAAITAKGSPFFTPITSFPFTFGHEVVGTVVETGNEVRNAKVGDRVVIEPVLHCAVRGIQPVCAACQAGHHENCTNIAAGDISAGVQTGYCRDTGGGWSSSFVAHDVQLHKVPDTVGNDEAVLVEPWSCAVHAVLASAGGASSRGWRIEDGEWRIEPAPFGSPSSIFHPPSSILHPPSSILHPPSSILVLGCGSIGLLTIAALRALNVPCRIIAVAKYPHQQELALKLGADQLVHAGRGMYDDLCKISGAAQHVPEIGKPTVLGGFDVVFDCVGTAGTLDDALRFTRSRGTTMLVGMPAIPKTVDWTTIWYKELAVRGTYTYGVEDIGGERRARSSWPCGCCARGKQTSARWSRTDLPCATIGRPFRQRSLPDRIGRSRPSST